MGFLYYGPREVPIRIEDRALAHLRLVITTKFRRHESFVLSWQHRPGEAGDHSSIWLHPSIALLFVFDEPEHQDLSRVWVEDLMNAASTTAGIHLTDGSPDRRAPG